MIDLTQYATCKMQTEPFAWARLDDLYTPEDAAALAASYPHDHFKLVEGYGGEKDYCYEARSLIAMGADSLSNPDRLSAAWRQFGNDLLSAEYRAAASALTGVDLHAAPIEANVFHYGAGDLLGPHRDLPEKVVVNIFYFNARWKREYGGCLAILNSDDANDVAAIVEPVVGTAGIFVRSDTSWHEVTRIAENCSETRRAVVVTFYKPGSISTMWPPGDTTPVHDYRGKTAG